MRVSALALILPTGSSASVAPDLDVQGNVFKVEAFFRLTTDTIEVNVTEVSYTMYTGDDGAGGSLQYWWFRSALY